MSVREDLHTASQTMLADLAALVAAESPSADVAATAACADVVAALGARLTGRRPERLDIAGRTHLHWRFGAGPTRVLLLGHLDTVWPAGTLARWPFTVAGGKATGPGVVDMKAGLVQLFHALSAVGSTEGVTVLVTSDEEIGSVTSRELIEQTARGAVATLVLEPSAGGALKTARKGTAMYRVRVTGRAAHAGLAPEDGINAGVELAHQILALAGLGDDATGTTVTPTRSAVGTTSNTVPAEAVVDVDVRAGDPAELARVDAAIHGLRPVLPGAGLRVEVGPRRPALTEAASGDLFALAGRLAERLGLPPLRGESVGGGSDGNLTAGLGVPTLDGLGAVGGNPHAEGEWVDLAAMPERTALVAALVDHLLRPDGSTVENRR